MVPNDSISRSRMFPIPASGVAGWFGVAATALVLTIVELLNRTVCQVPVPVGIAQVTAVYAAFVGGTSYGLLSAALIAAYAAYAFSVPGDLFHYDTVGLWRLGVSATAPPLIVLMVGIVRSRADRAGAALREKAVLEAQLAARSKSAQDLRRQRSEQQTIFHSVPAMIWFKDKKNRILRANRLAAQSIGKTVEEVEGRPTSDFYPHLAEKYLHDDLEVVATGKPKLGIMERYESVGGETKWIRTDKIPYRDDDGTIVGVIVFAVDITEQKLAQDELQRARDELEQRIRDRTSELVRTNESLRREIIDRKLAEELRSLSEQRLQQIIDNTTAIIYAKDPEGRYWLINRRFQELFHISRADVMNKTDYDVFPREAAAEFRANDQQVLRTGRPVEFEEMAPHDDGPHRYISLKFPLFDAAGRPTAVCGISTDITDRKRAEQELREHATAMERANRELAAARENAETANLAKSRFLANISHEIRTPLTAILGAAELLGGPEAPSDDRIDRCDMILRNGRHLLSLIDELLDISRIEAGRLDVRLGECSLVELLADVNAITDPLRRDRPVDYQVIFETPIPTSVRTDRTRLTQALTNLVNNALKFTHRGHVHVRVHIQPNAPDPRLIFRVEDTGVGIRQEDRERIFETFTQLDPVPRAASVGAGLGLPIARWIAERLGGALDVESTPGGGSRFTLRTATGPLDEVEWIGPSTLAVTPSLCSPSGADEPRRLRGRILLAEDAADTRDLVAFALRRAGAEVIAVPDGREAVEVSAEIFNLILLDIRMPELDGVATAREIRRRGYRGAMIALTASTAERDREGILSAGFDDIWAKPISLEGLVERASAYLESVHAPTRTEASRPPSSEPRDTRARWELAVSHFLDSLPDRWKALEVAVATVDSTKTCEILHQLVGAGGIHGFMDLSHEAARLLAQAKNPLSNDRPLDLREMEQMIAALRSLSARPESTPSSTTTQT